MKIRSIQILAGLAAFFVGCATHSSSLRQPAQEASSNVVIAPSRPVDPSKFKVIGGDQTSFHPSPAGPAIRDTESYDVIVVGSGLAGLSSATFLTDPKHPEHVLMLEKEPTVGGLASSGEFGDTQYDRGAAYWTSTYPEEQKILDYIGLGNFADIYPIPEPIDSYYVRGHYYKGIWDEKTIKQLPASFAVFHQELLKQNDDGLIPDQPFEEFDKMDLDNYSAAHWIRAMPESLAKRSDGDSKAIYARYKAELAARSLKSKDPMIDVVELMDLYCRSALGTNSDKVSAMAFANFYISEIVTRYTTPVGTNQATRNMVKILSGRKDLFSYKVSSPVTQIINHENDVEVVYENVDGKSPSQTQTQSHHVRSKYVVFSAQLGLAPRLIAGLNEKSKVQAAMMSNLGYSDYSVHGVLIKGHPYKECYDTWTRASDYSENDFTDFILGNWVATKGYTLEPTTNPDQDILTIYDPLSKDWLKKYTAKNALKIAQSAVDRLLNLYAPLFTGGWASEPDWKDKNVLAVNTSIWPYSVHIAVPGYYKKMVKVLRQPFGRIVFANNNLGTPAFEEALFRGHCGANNVLRRLDPSFVQEDWSKCPDYWNK